MADVDALLIRMAIIRAVVTMVKLVILAKLVVLVEKWLNDTNHHGRGGGVADPHGEEGRGQHEAEHQVCWSRSLSGSVTYVMYSGGHKEINNSVKNL